jgi:spermidine synthase
MVFVSGAAALVFETLWFRSAGLALGNSVWATSLVLSSFMAGLALGSFLVARVGARVRRPLLAYALLEVAIGVTGLTLVVVLPRLGGVLGPLFQVFLDRPVLMNSARLAIAFALLLAPSTAMGATLPLLVKALVRYDRDFGRVLGRLYGWNTLGAVVGALVAEVLFIGTLGVRGSGLAAASLNLLAAAGVFGLALRSRREAAAVATAGTRPPEDAASVTPPRRSSAISSSSLSLAGAAFVSGAGLLGLEVVWFRFMLFFQDSTSFVFAAMLSVVLAGIGVGGLVASFCLRHWSEAYRSLPFVALVSGLVVGFTYFNLIESLGLLSAFPVSVLSGIVFTFVGRALHEHIRDEAQAAATLVYANTVGAMTGSLIAGFVLIPYLGVEKSFFAIALAYGVVALLSRGTLPADPVRQTRHRYALGAATAIFGIVMALFPFGLLRNHYLPQILAPYTTDGSRLVASNEGVTEAAFYLQSDLFGQPRYHRLVTNGFSMSATVYRAKRYMRLFSYFPMALRSEAKNALLISYGVGVTARALVDQSKLERIDVVDISENVVELSREVDIFPDGHPLQDSRVRVHIEDGRFFLQTTETAYDIITAEPPPPRNAGIVNLYTKEYFGLIHRRLAPGGVVTYWLPVYQLEVAGAKAIVKGFCEAFSDCSLWTGAGTEWMLVGTKDLRGPIDGVAFSQLWKDVPGGMTTIGVETPEQLGALFIADAEFLREWTKGAVPLVDDHPHRIHGAPGARPANEVYLELMEAQESRTRFETSEWIRAVWPTELRASTPEAFEVQARVNQLLTRGGMGVPELYWTLTNTALESLPLMMLSTDLEDAPLLAEAAGEGVRSPLLEFFLAAHAFADRDYQLAARHLTAARALDPGSRELMRYLILSEVLQGDMGSARRLALELRSLPGEDPPRFWDWLNPFLDPMAGTETEGLESS